MKEYSVYLACAILSVTVFCVPFPIQAQNQSQHENAAAISSEMKKSGDTSTLGTTPTLHGMNNQANGNVSNAPGADAMMTQDLLLVNPNKTEQAVPLQSFVGDTLKITVDHHQINFRKLAGIKITVINDTSRPLVIDGKGAKAILGSKNYTNVPLPVLQKKVLPREGWEANAGRMVTDVAPSALTVGGTTTVEDYEKMKRPIRRRYGSDQRRRLAEMSRFGERILWPHQETQGILYFDTEENISSAKIQIPAHTLFDVQDSAVLEGI